MSTITTAAGHRRRAYQCLRCLHRDEKVFIEARYRVMDHFLKKHVSLDQVPYYCRWCLFVAFKKEDLVKHVQGYSRHRVIMEEKGLPIDEDYLVENRSPYEISERDVAALSQDESARHWSKAAANTKKGDFLKAVMESTYLDAPSETGDGSLLMDRQESLVPELVAEHAALADVDSISPSLPALTDIRQYVAPLQHLASILSFAGQPVTAQLASPGAQVPNIMQPPPVSTLLLTPPEVWGRTLTKVPNSSPAAVPSSTPVAEPSSIPAAEPSNTLASKPGMVSEPVSSTPVEGDVLDTLPTREECRAFRRAGSVVSTSSSSSSSSNSSAGVEGENKAELRHKELMGAISSLQESVRQMNEQLVRQYQSTNELAKSFLELTKALNKPPTTAPLPTIPPPSIPPPAIPPPTFEQFLQMQQLQRMHQNQQQQQPLQQRIDQQQLPYRTIPETSSDTADRKRERDRSPLRRTRDRSEHRRYGKENQHGSTDRRDRRVVHHRR